jgi:exodeoxyribonuclease VII large subunit
VVPDLADEVRTLGVARARLDRAIGNLLDREAHRLEALRSRPVLDRPELLVDARAVEVVALRERAGRVLGHRLDRAGTELTHTLARLRALSPAATLARGYAIVRHGDAVLRDPAGVAPGDALRIRLADGELSATVSTS